MHALESIGIWAFDHPALNPPVGAFLFKRDPGVRVVRRIVDNRALQPDGLLHIEHGHGMMCVGGVEAGERARRHGPIPGPPLHAGSRQLMGAGLFEKRGEVCDVEYSKAGRLIVARRGLVAFIGALSNITQRRVMSRVR